MTIEQIEAILRSTGYLVAYFCFTPKQMETTKPPYIVYTIPDTATETADSKVILEINSFRVELYTLKLNRTAEKVLEKAFADNKIVYNNKSRTFIQSENIHQTVYEFEMEEKVQ